MRVTIDRKTKSDWKHTVSLHVTQPARSYLQEIFGHGSSQVLVLLDQSQVTIEAASAVVNGGTPQAVAFKRGIERIVPVTSAVSYVGSVVSELARSATETISGYSLDWTDYLSFRVPPEFTSGSIPTGFGGAFTHDVADNHQSPNIAIARIDFSTDVLPIATSPSTINDFRFEIALSVDQPDTRSAVVLLPDMRGISNDVPPPEQNTPTTALPLPVEFRRQITVPIGKTESRRPSPLSITQTDLSGDGRTTDIKMQNSQLYVEFLDDDIRSRYLLSAAGSRTGGSRSQLLGQLETRPVNPIAPQPAFSKHQFTTLNDESQDSRSYRMQRVYQFETDAKKLLIDSTVSVFAGLPFFIVAITYRNIGEEKIVLDHPSSHVHDGLHVIEGLRLHGRSDSDSSYRLYLPNAGQAAFSDLPKWTVIRGSEWGTLFDGSAGLTFGLLRRDTPPKMWIEENGEVDYLTEETFLLSNEAILPGDVTSYSCMIGFHDGGEKAPMLGKQLYQFATQFMT